MFVFKRKSSFVHRSAQKNLTDRNWRRNPFERILQCCFSCLYIPYPGIAWIVWFNDILFSSFALIYSGLINWCKRRTSSAIHRHIARCVQDDRRLRFLNEIRSFFLNDSETNVLKLQLSKWRTKKGQKIKYQSFSISPVATCCQIMTLGRKQCPRNFDGEIMMKIKYFRWTLIAQN